MKDGVREMKVSVVIPTYNRANCIGDAIESALKQAYLNKEIIVVDDGSTDNTFEVLNRYGEQIRVIRQENAGVSAARNAGVKAASGDWIAFLDSDDLWMPDKLQRQVEDLKEFPTAIGHMVDAVIIGYDGKEVTLFGIRGKADRFRREPFLQRPLRDVLTVQFFTPTWMLRRDVLLRCGLFRPDFSIYEDFELLSRFAMEGPFVVSHRTGVTVRRVAGAAQSLSNQHISSRVRALENLIKIYENALRDPRSDREERSLVRRLLGGVRFELSTVLAKNAANASPTGVRWRSVWDDPGARSFLRALMGQFGGTLLWGKLTRLLRRRDSFRRSEKDAVLK